jgi:hypothetical protein
MRSRLNRSVVSALLAVAASSAVAQQPAATTLPPPAPSPAMPNVGDMAPDFTIRGVTRYGVLANRPRLSDFKGQTVVLAFFFQARTRG